MKEIVKRYPPISRDRRLYENTALEKRSIPAVLFDKLLKNACSPEEVDELMGILSREEQDPDMLKLLYDRMSAPEVPAEVDEAVRQRLQNRLEQILSADLAHPADTLPLADPATLPVKTRSRIISGRFWRVAAAAVLLFGGIAAARLFFLSGNRNKKNRVQASRQHLQNDVAPGYSKAILTLGNGHKIILDNAGDGILAEQGNTNILKLDSGRLAYKNSPGKTTQVLYNTLMTPPGGQYQLILPDGSKVWLDASSSIVYPTAFTGRERSVEITGQAYFEVARNPKLPFIVHSRASTVEVLGTGFNVNAYEDETMIKTTLVDGSVKVIDGSNTQILVPGQQAQSNDKGAIKVVNADLEETVAWKNGFFSFRHADIQTVMKQLCRWYDVSVKYEGTLSKGESFSGEIGRNLTLADVLNGLQLAKIHYRIEADKKLVILP